MAIIERKCSQCKQKITIDSANIVDVIYFDSLYYHTTCFEEMCIKKSQSKRGNPIKWAQAKDNMTDIQRTTKEMLVQNFAKDALNEWLLDNYDVVSVPKSLWYMVADLSNGIYKGKKCRVVTTNTLLDMWKWGQKKLNSIHVRNQANHCGPKTDIERLRYDLAILLNHMEDYNKHIKQIKVLEAEQKQRQKEVVAVDYSKIKVNNNDNGLDDISDLLDALI